MTYIKAQTKSNCYLDGSLQALAYSIMVNARKEFKISFPDTIKYSAKGPFHGMMMKRNGEDCKKSQQN